MLATPANGAEAIVFSIEASQQPEYIECILPGASITLVPVAGTPGWDGDTRPPIRTVHQQYVCPPGGTLRPLVMYGDGHGGGCSSPEPPDDAFLRVTKIGVEKVWSRTVDATLPLHVTDDAGYQKLDVVVRGTGQALLTAEVASADGEPSTMSVGAGPRDLWEVSATMTDPHGGPYLARLHATVYGPCPSAGPCEPPASAVPPSIVEKP